MFSRRNVCCRIRYFSKETNTFIQFIVGITLILSLIFYATNNVTVTGDHVKSVITNRHDGIQRSKGSNSLPDVNDVKMTKSTKRILLYNPVHWWFDWIDGSWETNEVLKSCPVSDCVISKDKLLLHSSDAVVFKMQLLKEKPPEKRPGQIWTMVLLEPMQIVHHKDIIKTYIKRINWTLSYRRDSDFFVPYGTFKVNDKNVVDIKYNFSSKSGGAVGFISHCNAPSRREKYAAALNKYFPTDVYGACGKLKCGNTMRHKDSWNIKHKSSSEHNKCFEVLDTKYKFFLSFENAICFDYITEKAMHMVLEHNIVPIIRNGANVTLYMPHLSYVDTRDYKHVEDLGQYLTHLNNSETEYRKYFEWRRYYHTEGIQKPWTNAFCNLCKRLHHTGGQQKLYENIFEWANSPGGKPACKQATDV